MPIKYKFTLSFLVVALVIGSLAVLSYYRIIREAEHLTRHEAESIASVIAFDITSHILIKKPLSLEHSPELQDLILRFRNFQKRDIVVVDTEQNIVADAVPEEIGTTFAHDDNNEVGQTIEDGLTRSFTEISEAYPEGIRSLVMPLDTKEGVRVGAIILEYTPLYDEITGHARDSSEQFLISFFIALIIASSVGYVMSRQISRPLKEMEEAAMRISEGDLTSKITSKSSDEIGTLAKTFNRMISNINMARDDLLKANTELEQEIAERNMIQDYLTLKEKKYRSLFESATDAIFILDLKGNIIDANAVAYERLGYTKDELLSIHIKQLDPKEHADKVPERMALLREKGSAVFESAQIKKDGTILPVEVNAKIIDYEGGQVFLSVVRDITERKETERQLRESEARFRGAFENAAVGASFASLNGRFIKVNRALCEMLGYKEDELLSRTFSDITHPDDVEIGLDAAKKLVSGELIHTAFEKRYVRKDGSLINVIISPSVVRDSDGNPLHFVALFQDITERKKAERQLKDSEEAFRNLFESASDAIFILDMEGNFIDFNRRAHERLGYAKDEMMSMGKIYNLHPPEFASKVAGQMKNLMKYGSAVFEWVHNRKDGTEMPVEVNVMLLEFKGKEAMISIVRDITDRKKAEEEIKRSLKEKEVLLKEIHHRVKNNMAIISSLLQLQAKYGRDEDLELLFRDSQSRISSMALVHEKLYQTKDFANINFREYVEELVGHLLGTYGKKEGDIELLLSISDINLNIDMMIPCGLIMNELVTNSLKYAFEGVERPEITIAFNRHDHQAELVYSDNGIGIPEDIEFPNSKTLGLQIVNMLSIQLKGSVDLKRNGGTEFLIKLELQGNG